MLLHLRHFAGTAGYDANLDRVAGEYGLPARRNKVTAFIGIVVYDQDGRRSKSEVPGSTPSAKPGKLAFRPSPMSRVLQSLSLIATVALVALFLRLGFESEPFVSVPEPVAYRDHFTNPYWPSITSPKLTTPQWIGENGVEAAAVLSIDDMRGIEPYQSFVEPILQRLEAIDGRAPLSIFTNQIDPNEPQIQRWLNRGVSIEVHTIDHPCPLLHDGDFANARGTVHRCIDLLQGIPNMRPVTYRMPCCDSMNSVSPRFYDEIMGPLTPDGNFLASDSSVFQIFTRDDPELPRDIFSNGNEKRFERYIPAGKDFVNTITNYPYPYLIGKQHWEFPCTVPSDWEAQHLQGKSNPRTVEDLKAALDATVAKQGLFVLVFHPHGWIESTQVIELIDHAQRKHGSKLMFLNMAEVQARIDQQMLAGRPIRKPDGTLSGTRVLDLDGDGYMDVVHRQGESTTARIWEPTTHTWQARQDVTVVDEPLILDLDGDGQSDEPDNGALRFWDLDGDGDLDAVYSDATRFAIYRRDGEQWESVRAGDRVEASANGPPPFLRSDGSNNGVWMGRSAFIVQNEDTAEEPNVIRRVAFADILTVDAE